MVIGLGESDWLEAKRQPYSLDQDSQKFELAKDVAALANAGGGVILLGFPTRKVSNEEFIRAVQPFESASFQAARYRQVLRGRVFPMPDSVSVRRVQTHTQKAIAYIDVPPQPPELQPFMLRERTSAGKTRTNSVAIPVRSGSDTEWDSAEALHSLIVAGRVALRSAQAAESSTP